jgi:uncharacterized membrane protein YbaN (DUF454 family)
MKRKLFALAGCLFVAIAVIGVFVPLLPTTPFLLLAAACLNKGSARMHNWLVNHSIWGPTLSNWESNGVIDIRTKIIATVLMLSMSSYPLAVMDFSIYIKAMAALSIVLILAFIWTRPSK